MKENRLSVLTLQALSLEDLQAKKRLTVNDGGSLYGTVSIRNEAVIVRFEFRYRTGTGTGIRSKAVGTWPDKTLAAIRKERDALRANVREGIDPLEQKKARKLAQLVEIASEQQRHKAELERLAAEAAGLRTVADLFSDWIKTKAVAHKDGGAFVRQMFETHVLTQLGAVPLPDVTKDMLRMRLSTVAEKAPVMANRLYAQLNNMFDYARRHDMTERNHLEAIKTPDYCGSVEQPSTRELTRELKELFDKIPVSGLMPDKQTAVWLLLATGLRVGELARAKWSNVNLETRQWIIPASDSKNGLAHTVYLSDFAISKLQELNSQRLGFEYLFCGASLADHMNEKTLTKLIRDRQRETAIKGRTPNNEALRLSGGEWTPHDLRRTFATICGDLGVDGAVIEKALNHRPASKIVRTYQRSERAEELREAWARVGSFLERINVDNVVELRKHA